MGFRSGKGNIYNQLKAENAALKQQLADERFKPAIKAFADELGTAILVLLASKPYLEWPELCKAAFEHVRRKLPVPAHYYRDRLPK